MAGWLVACGPGEPVPEGGAEHCGFFTPRDSSEARVTELGVVDRGEFILLEDGASVPLVAGFQGGYMLTPAVRVEAHDGDPDTMCASVSITNELDEGAPQEIDPGVLGFIELERRGEVLESGYLDDLLTYDATEALGLELELSATVTTDAFEGRVRRRVVIVAPR